MARYTKSMETLIEEFAKMPGIGPKTAERLAFYILKAPREDVAFLASAIMKVKQSIGFCKVCNNLSEGPTCQICQDPRRDKSTVCVVEEPNDVIALEKAGGYKGVYHVLLGALSPLEGVGPEDLKIKELLSRIKSQKIKEIIIATDSDTEGEATALYLTRVIKPLGVKMTRIAYGIPVGSSLQYADQATLARAMEGRYEIK